jgi:hypothetical protein
VKSKADLIASLGVATGMFNSNVFANWQRSADGSAKVVIDAPAVTAQAALRAQIAEHNKSVEEKRLAKKAKKKPR